MRSKKWMVIETIMLAVWIVTTIIFVNIAFSDGVKCLANPLVYGVKTLEADSGVGFSCSCNFDNRPDEKIFVNANGWEIRDQTPQGFGGG